MNQAVFAENMVEQYKFSTTSNILGSSSIDFGPKKDGEPEGKE